jgi:hypothetical protein
MTTATTMNLMELLLQVDEGIRSLVGVDEATIQAVLAEVAQGPRRPGLAPEVDDRMMLAGLLNSIAVECGMVRDRLGWDVTAVAHIDVQAPTGTIRQQPPSGQP